jgi:hypothetical protein
LLLNATIDVDKKAPDHIGDIEKKLSASMIDTRLGKVFRSNDKSQN